jgi:hypothetical protein
MKVVKHSGMVVDFDRNKLNASLLKSGADAATVDTVLLAIENELYEGISTKQIYKLAFSRLKKSANSHAARYNLREALRLLGPAGFFFEKYIARLFAAEHFETRTNLVLQGHCVTHEIDVAIQKDKTVSMIECKFHSGREANSDVKVPMYILSRFNDLKNESHSIFSKKDAISSCWIITNNRFTTDAISFASCMGMNLLSWDYPKKNNLRDKIDNHHLYPITCLTTLSFAEKDRLLVMDCILVKELVYKTELLEHIGLSPSRMKNVIKEATELCRLYA